MSKRKQPSEELTFVYEFGDALGDVAIASVTSTVSTPRGDGANMTQSLDSEIDGTNVLVRWAGGEDGEDYLTTVKIIADDGEKYELDGIILVRERAFALIELEEAKEHLRVYDDSDDELIQRCIDAAIASIDGPKAWLGRSIKLQTVTERLTGFPTSDDDSIRLSYPPALSIDAVEYLDSSGEWQELDAEDYELDDGYIFPAFGTTWPTPATRRNSVRITYQAGYSVLPDEVRQALLLTIGDFYAQRESMITGSATLAPVSANVEDLLAGFRSVVL